MLHYSYYYYFIILFIKTCFNRCVSAFFTRCVKNEIHSWRSLKYLRARFLLKIVYGLSFFLSFLYRLETVTNLKLLVIYFNSLLALFTDPHDQHFMGVFFEVRYVCKQSWLVSRKYVIIDFICDIIGAPLNINRIRLNRHRLME